MLTGSWHAPDALVVVIVVVVVVAVVVVAVVVAGYIPGFKHRGPVFQRRGPGRKRARTGTTPPNIRLRRARADRAFLPGGGTRTGENNDAAVYKALAVVLLPSTRVVRTERVGVARGCHPSGILGEVARD